MSTVTMSTPARQPFGSVSDARLRKLTNLKNKQNALAATPSSAVKRQAPAEFDEPDTENIDPIHFFSDSSKKAKTFSFDSSSLTKAPHYSLNVTPANTPVKRGNLSLTTGNKRKAEPTTTSTHNPTPFSHPAGRSPKHKRIGILSKRRHTTNHITRIDPPSFSSPKITQPFSIATALHGTVPSPLTSKPNPKLSRKGWHFTIHEDTPEDELANLMQHSTQTLDISDEEGGGTRSISPSKGDRCNKENVAPADYHGVNAANMTSRRDMMTDDTRAPLGDLLTKDYYAEGCDASSVIVIPAEDEEGCEESSVNKIAHVAEEEEPSPTTHTSISASTSGWEGVWAQMQASHHNSNTSNASGTCLEENDEDAKTEIQIWESESAKDEAEAVDGANAPAAAVVGDVLVAA